MTDSVYRSQGSSGGRVLMAGSRNPEQLAYQGLRGGGVLLTGVVVATYVQVDGEPFEGSKVVDRVASVYCDVLLYGQSPNVHGKVLGRVPVCGFGMHNGPVWKPRAATMDVTGEPISLQSNPRNLDGDHVVVQFLEDSVDRPIITGRLPHPLVGLGNEDLPDAGHRMRLQKVDGDPSFWKQNGTFFGVNERGDFVVDTTRAHEGNYDEDGAESPANDGNHGDMAFKLGSLQTFKVVGLETDGTPTFLVEVKDGEITVSLEDSDTRLRITDTDVVVEIAGGQSLQLVQNGNNTVATLGSGINHSMIYEMFNTWYTTVIKPALLAHTHPVPASGLSVPASGFTVNAASTNASEPVVGSANASGTATAGASTDLPGLLASDTTVPVKSNKLLIPSG